MNAVHVSFQRYAADVVLPDYATAGAAGMDIAAYICLLYTSDAADE